MALKPSLFGGKGTTKRSTKNIKYVEPRLESYEEEEFKSESTVTDEAKHNNTNTENKEGYSTNRILAWVAIALVVIFPLGGLIVGIYAFFKCKKEKDEYSAAIALGAVIMGIFIMIMYAVVILQLYSFTSNIVSG